MLESATLAQIDFPQEITISSGTSMFYFFRADALTLDTIIVQNDRNWCDLSGMFHLSNVICNHIIIRDKGDNTPTVVTTGAFSDLQSAITTLPDIKFELARSSITMRCAGTYDNLPDTITALPE